MVCIADGFVVIAIADGAGSAPRSEIGSRIAVQLAAGYLLENQAAFASDAGELKVRMQEAAMLAKAGVDTEAQRLGVEPRDLASTLILCIAGNTRVSVLQVGDGAVVARTAGGELICIGQPTKGEHFNETEFLTEQGVDRVGKFSEITAHVSDVAAFTDGFETIALNLANFEPHPGFFNPLFNFFKGSGDEEVLRSELTKFMESPRVAEQVDDDLTLALACWDCSDSAPPAAPSSEA